MAAIMVIHQRRLRLRRLGLASLEAVFATAITLPVVIFLLWLGSKACIRLFHVIGTLVGWPFL